MINKLFGTIAKIKIYFGSSALYLSIINFIMILATFKATYNINISAYYIVPIGFVGVIIMGWLDYTLIAKHQIKYANKKNDIKAQLNRLEDKINKLKEE